MISAIRKEGLQYLTHYGDRKGRTIKYVVIHWTASSTFESAFNQLRKVGLSYHYVVDGSTVYELVDPKFAAYHAGDINLNRESLGVSHVGIYGKAMADETYTTSGQFIADFLKANNLLPTRDVVKLHREVRPKKLVFWGGIPRWIETTECPGLPGKLGSLDIDRLMGEIVKYYYGVLSPDEVTPQPIPSPVDNPAPEPELQPEVVPHMVTAIAKVRVRQESSTQSATVGFKQANEQFSVIGGLIEGERVDNNNKWWNTGYGYIWSGATKEG